jgi:DNA repair and recombination RAD54-like protein
LQLFDPDWNPANDKQAAARVWRDGQRKRVYVYRFLSTGTLEEKIFQRQVSKEGLKSAVSSSGGADGADGDLIANTLSKDEMRKLFQFNADTQSDCHDGLKCKGCVPGEQEAAQVGKPSEEDLKCMGHHSTVITVPDAIMQRIGFREVRGVLTRLSGAEARLL